MTLTAAPARSAATPDTPETPLTPRRPRAKGVDIARSFAMLGMLVVHCISANHATAMERGTSVSARVLAPLVDLAHGRAEGVFVILAGLMVGWQALRATTPQARRRLRVSLVKRGLVLFAIGLALQVYQSAVSQILTFYGAYFVLAAALIAVRLRWLWVAAVVAALVLPIGRAAWEQTQAGGTTVATRGYSSVNDKYGQAGGETSTAGDEKTDSPAAPADAGSAAGSGSNGSNGSNGSTGSNGSSTAGGETGGLEGDAGLGEALVRAPERVLLTGTYALVPEVALFLFGLALGGLGAGVLTSPKTLVTGLAGLAALPVLSEMLAAIAPENVLWAAVYSTRGHAPATFALLTACCYALTALGVGGLLARRMPRASAPLAALGRWALTFYIGHILALIGYEALGWRVPIDGSPQSLAGQAASVAAIAAIPALVAGLALAFPNRRGPLEAVVHRLTRTPVRR